MEWSVEVTPAFIHFWTDQLNESFIDEIRKDESLKLLFKFVEIDKEEPKAHKCSPKAYINQEERVIFASGLQKLILDEDGQDSILLNKGMGDVCIFNEDSLKEIRQSKGICTCSVMDLTFQVNHMVNDKCRNLQYELYFKMF
jgi:hypothetical protein